METFVRIRIIRSRMEGSSFWLDSFPADILFLVLSLLLFCLPSFLLICQIPWAPSLPAEFFFTPSCSMNATEGFTATLNRFGVFFIMVFLFRSTLIIRRLVSFREKSLCGTVGFWLRWLNCASRLTSSQPSGIPAVELCTPHHPISPTL